MELTVKILTREAANKLSRKNVIIPDGYTEIKSCAFKGRKTIINVIIPMSFTTRADAVERRFTEGKNEYDSTSR